MERQAGNSTSAWLDYSLAQSAVCPDSTDHLPRCCRSQFTRTSHSRRQHHHSPDLPSWPGLPEPQGNGEETLFSGFNSEPGSPGSHTTT